MKKKLNDTKYYLNKQTDLNNTLSHKLFQLSDEKNSYSDILHPLLDENKKLTTENRKLANDLDEILKKYNQQTADIQKEKMYKEQKHLKFQEQKIIKEEEKKAQQKKINDHIILADEKLKYTPEQIICLRQKVFMNEEESRKFYHICEEFKSPDYLQKYNTKQIYIFSQVALHSIFDITKTGEELNEIIEYEYTKKYYLSKSVDFLVCATYYHNEKRYVEYKPILGIEIDGKYHERTDVQKRDEIKEQLFKAVNIPLLRFPLEENKFDKEAIRHKIRNILLNGSQH